MQLKAALDFLKPNILKIMLSLAIALLFLLPAEKTCGAGFLFSFCYDEYGFPFKYLINGDIDFASQFTGDFALGSYFKEYKIREYKNFLLNYQALLLNLLIAYILSCAIALYAKRKRIKPKK